VRLVFPFELVLKPDSSNKTKLEVEHMHIDISSQHLV